MSKVLGSMLLWRAGNNLHKEVKGCGVVVGDLYLAWYKHQANMGVTHLQAIYGALICINSRRRS